MRLGGPQSRFVRFGEEKNFLPLPGLEPLTFSMTANHFNTVGALDYTKFCCRLSKSLWANAGTLYHNLNKVGNVRITTDAEEKQQVLNINQTWIFCKDFKKVLKYQISWKSPPPVGVGLFHPDRQTDERTWHDTTRHFFPHLMQSVTHNYISRRMRQTERAANMSEVRNASNVVIESSEMEKQLEKRTCRLEVNMKMANS